jgi:hypothetical protein
MPQNQPTVTVVSSAPRLQSPEYIVQQQYQQVQVQGQQQLFYPQGVTYPHTVATANYANVPQTQKDSELQQINIEMAEVISCENVDPSGFPQLTSV